jgi:protein-disulfide isomerase
MLLPSSKKSNQDESKMKKAGTLSLLLLAGLLIACEKKPYVELDGRKITESDLRKDANLSLRLDQLKASIEKQYNAQLEQMLQELAHKRMIEKEAKEKGMDAQAYLDSIQRSASIPSQQEVDDFYNNLKKNGQLQNAGEGIKNDIANYLAQQNREEAIQAEIARLKKKYRYRVPKERVEISTAGEPHRGGKDAKVTIVEFSDFECPFCMRAQKSTRELRERYGDRIQFVFKDFPLDFHQNAMGAHIAANCIQREKPEVFWKFFDGIFDPARDKATLKMDSLRSRAISLGVDAGKFDACINDPAIMKEIEEDIKEGSAIGVSGTPAFFINGRLLSGAQPVEAFIELIEEELAN